MTTTKGLALGLCLQLVSSLPAGATLPAGLSGSVLHLDEKPAPTDTMKTDPGAGLVLGNSLVKEHFRIRSIERVLKPRKEGSASGTYSPEFRVVLIAVSPIKDLSKKGADQIQVEEGSLIVASGREYALRDLDKAASPDNVVPISGEGAKPTPQGTPEGTRPEGNDQKAARPKAGRHLRIQLSPEESAKGKALGPGGNLPKLGFKVDLDMDLGELDGLSGDDEKAFGYYLRYFPRSVDKPWIWSGPLDVQLFSGAIWSTNFAARSDGEKANFFKEHGYLRLDATQLFGLGSDSPFFLQSIVGAQLEPTQAIEVKDVSGAVKAIRNTSSMQGDLDLAFGIAALEHLNVSIGWREVWRHSKSETDPASPSPDQPEGIKSQHYLFLRLQQHDPQWSGSFIEFANGRDPLFRSALHPDAEERKVIRGRVSFRPERWSATSFFLEGSMSQPWHRVEGNFDESRVIMGFRIDMKNFSLTWPF